MELRALLVLHLQFAFDALDGAFELVALMSRMRFAVDVRSLMDRPTGIGRYTQQLVAHLQRAGDVVLYSFGGQRPSPALEKLALHERTRFVHHPLPMRLVRRLWRTGLGRRLESVIGDFDVAVAAETTMPRTRRPVLAVVYDLLFLEHPEWFNDYTRRAGPENLADVVEAAQVITISRRTQRALLAFHPVLADRCHLVAPAVSPSTVLYGGDSADFLFVGTREPRKGLDVVARALVGLGEKVSGSLVVVGGAGWGAQGSAVDTLRARGRLRELGFATDDDIARERARAMLAVVPAFDEGFGLPLAEAMAAGTPTLASDIEVFREIGGDACAYAAVNDVGAWERALLSLSKDPAARAALSHAGPSRMEAYASDQQWEALQPALSALRAWGGR